VPSRSSLARHVLDPAERKLVVPLSLASFPRALQSCWASQQNKSCARHSAPFFIHTTDTTVVLERYTTIEPLPDGSLNQKDTRVAIRELSLPPRAVKIGSIRLHTATRACLLRQHQDTQSRGRVHIAEPIEQSDRYHAPSALYKKDDGRAEDGAKQWQAASPASNAEARAGGEYLPLCTKLDR